ncbi:hypothetical protein P4O66_020179 [Electrophorus voltai]|uniref:Centromere protein F-like n=1 Tax=Electrophorus voltai TaxID=2609070 RepID=A0AAD8ZVF9_9TELE|nr:hypothetical protein P4O66_020179 [Electrophorus voltai]
MSWAAEDWTAGLSNQALQKVQELQALVEKLNRERQQRQLQLGNSDAALHKQKQKYEDVRVELTAVQRELLGVREEARGGAQARERLAHELQTKVAQVCALEGQLDSARALAQNLTQEIKRLPSMNIHSSQYDVFFSLCFAGDKDGTGGEGDAKTHPIHQQLLFGESPKPSVHGVLSEVAQQPHKTPPLRRRVYQSEARPFSSVFPWDRDDTRSTPRGRPASTSSSSISSNDVITLDKGSRDGETEEALRKERDEACLHVSGLQRELQLEKERCQEAETHLTQAQRELSTKDQKLTRSTDELARAQTRIMQEGDRAQAAELRVKQLQEELKCQRQNAETSRCNAEQRRRDMEREHQRELQELQRERQSLEKQHHQENNRLTQEIQQARTLHNTLQAQHDKLALQKQTVERDLEDVHTKLKNREADLTESQKREAQMLEKLTESLKESESLRLSLDQLKKREKSLEVDVKRLTEELAEALKLIKELQVSHPFTPVAVDSFTPVLSIHHGCTSPRQHSSHRNRALKAERPSVQGILTYPPDREPGEGIDSEHISVYGSENTLKLSIKQADDEHGAGSPSVVDMDSSMTEQDTGIEDTDTESYMSDSTSERLFKDDAFPQKDICHDTGNENSTPLDQEKKQDPSLAELENENAVLREELCDVKRELEQRLEDLETQRGAEAEARTKLKQLSKKHSTQVEQHRAKALELKEKGGKLEAQLDMERKETTRLREVVAALEKAAEKRLEEREREQEERQEENTQLKEDFAEMERKVAEHEGEGERIQKELAALQCELLQEREERGREREEEKKRLKNSEMEGLKIAELQAKLDQLQRSAGLEDINVQGNMPLSYLQLGNQTHTTYDITAFENDVISPLSFCEPVNLQNIMFSKETETMALITEGRTQTKSSECSQQNREDNTTAEELKEQAKTKEMMDLDNTTVLVLEVERLRTQRDREAEKAKNAQKKLDTLQCQVTSQTQLLTLAFENQSKHIEDLLRELQERDDALRSRGMELQNCLEEIALLKSYKLKEMDSGLPLNTSLEDLEDQHCNLVVSCATITTEMVKEEASQFVEDKTLHADPLQSCSNEEARNDQPGNVSPTSDVLHMSNVTVDNKVHMSLPILDVHYKDSALFTENATAKGPLEQLATAQKGSHHVLHKNTENPKCEGVPSSKETDRQNDALVLQRLLEYPTDDLNALKRVIYEFYEAQNELSLLKVKHKQLTLQLEEVSREDLLSIKQENEQLKLKLLEKEKGLEHIPVLRQQESSDLANTQQEGLSSKDCGKHCPSPSSGLEETVDVDGSSEDGLRNSKEDGGEENGECEIETLSALQADTPQEQLQVLQAQNQLLSEQSRQQSEELQRWRISALSSEEILGHHSNGHSIVLVREDELILPCCPDSLHVHSRQRRSMVQQGGLSQERGCFGHGTGDNQMDYQLGSEKTTVHWQPILNAKELIAKSNGSIQANDNLTVEIRDMNANTEFSSSPASFSEIEIFDDRPDLVQYVKKTGPRDDDQQAVSVNLDIQLKENTVRKESQDVVSISPETQSKVISPKLSTEAPTKKHTQKPTDKHDAFTSLQYGKALVNTPDYQIKHAAAPGRQTDKPLKREEDVAIMCLALDQSQISEVTTVLESLRQEKAKEVKSMSTQTYVHMDWEEEALGGSISPGCGHTVIHASTQTYTDEPKQREEEEEQDTGSADSAHFSPAPPGDPEKLLFSGTFPIPADPAHLAERIRRNRSRMSVAYDDIEYEPYGLPEVVMKGFADIPMGPACPYVLRRGLLGTDALPLSLREPTLKETEDEVDP